jgi:hypothetical protein
MRGTLTSCPDEKVQKGLAKGPQALKMLIPRKKKSKKQASGLKAAKNALIAEATDFIGRFKKLQANSHAHIVENSENDCIE